MRTETYDKINKKVIVKEVYERDCCRKNDLVVSGIDRFGDNEYKCKFCNAKWQYGITYEGEQMAIVKELYKVAFEV